MGKSHGEIDSELSRWLLKQPVYFVATAPLAADGLINCSPKGMDTFRILDSRTVAYLDLAGSGIETVAHLKENGRITIMFCAFEGAPKIVRLQGTGTPVFPEDAEFEELRKAFPELPGTRSIILVSLRRISDTCGFGVPRMDFLGQRETLRDWAEKKGEDGIDRYIREKNVVSVDGLPGIVR